MVKIEHNDTFIFYIPVLEDSLEIPLAGCPISAGFPSPADDYHEVKIDLNKELIKHPYSTFYVRVSGNSMVNAGIFDGDLLIVDRSIEPKDHSITLCCIDGQFTVKRIQIEKNRILLIAENEKYPPIEVNEGADLIIWGTVLHAIKSFK